MVTGSSVLDALRSSRRFGHLRIDRLDDLDGAVVMRNVQSGELVARKGAAARSAWVVVAGRVRVGTKQKPLGSLAAGDDTGVDEVLSGGSHPATLRAEEPTTLLELSSEALARLLAAEAAEDVQAVEDGHWGAQLGTASLLAWRSLLHRRSRVITTLSTVTVIFTMVLLITGMAEHFRTEPRVAVESFGADTWIVPPDATGVFTSAASLPVEIADSLDPEGGEWRAEPAIIARHAIVNDRGIQDIMLVGHLPAGFSAPEIRSGSAAKAGELVVSGGLGAEVGDVLAIGDQRLRVAGIAHNVTLFAGIPFVWVSLDQAQLLVHAGRPSVSAFAVQGAAPIGDGWSVLTSEEVIADAARPLERATASIDTMSILLWIVAGLVIGAVAYVTALERTRDFAVIKAVGGSDVTLLVSLGLQSLLTALAAVGLASALEGFVEPVFPMEVSVPGSAFVWLPIVAAVVALLASTAGIRRIRSIDPSAAFGAAA